MGSPDDSARLLVLDDEPDIRLGLSVLLESRGHQVRCAATGMDAVHLARAHRFDVVLLDIRLPDIDGLEVLSLIREHDPDQVVLMMTAFPSVDTAEVVDALAAADGVYVRGGDQSRYLEHWTGTPLHVGLIAAWERGAVIGGSSAGCAILGQRIYDARVGGVAAWEALLDPYDPTITFTDDFLPALPGVITDTHFTERGRLGRLAVFLERWKLDGEAAPTGIGVDPMTALFVYSDGTAEVHGSGSVTIVDPTAATATLEAARAGARLPAARRAARAVRAAPAARRAASRPALAGRATRAARGRASRARIPGMGSFLRDNWLWIVLPAAIALVLLIVFVALTMGDSPVPTRYQIR